MAETNRPLTARMRPIWDRCPPGKNFGTVNDGSLFSWNKLHPNLSSPTQTSTGHLLHWLRPRTLNRQEVVRVQSFPDDYDFGSADPTYVCGMSVPPFMVQRIALQLARTLKGGVEDMPDIKPRTGPWLLSELKDVPKNGLKVFSCFACGGGSTMGYKLAGFDMLGCNEIDPEMIAIYRKNHHPQLSYLEPIQTFRKRNDLPDQLFRLDVLDGSPPCSSFSMAGNREKDWGKKKKFREGQAEQVLDDLFFDFIALADKLRPKVVVAENVKGLIQGAAKAYVKRIFEEFRKAGYETQLFLLDASYMGVPQRRERTFFVARRMDLKLPKVGITANERRISVSEAFAGLPPPSGIVPMATAMQKKWWDLTAPGVSFSKAHPKGSWFNSIKLHPDIPANTLAASGGAGGLYHYSHPRKLTDGECLRIQTFPDDYDLGGMHGQYVCGMSVPPFMMQRVALSVARSFAAAERRP